MEKINSIIPKYLKILPKYPEAGILYISLGFGISTHLCACGCGEKTALPLGDGEWTLTDNNGNVSLTPSIGNWAGEKPKYHAHYYIIDNKIKWC